MGQRNPAPGMIENHRKPINYGIDHIELNRTIDSQLRSIESDSTGTQLFKPLSVIVATLSSVGTTVPAPSRAVGHAMTKSMEMTPPPE
jgi:hypothetical protein